MRATGGIELLRDTAFNISNQRTHPAHKILTFQCFFNDEHTWS